MRPTLQRWINDADTARHLRHFDIPQVPLQLAQVRNRIEDYYISLVGELFRCIATADVLGADWAQLGNAFLQFSMETPDAELQSLGISRGDAALFSAASFYFGDFPASACLAMRHSERPADSASLEAACFDFLARPLDLRSDLALVCQAQLKEGDLGRIEALVDTSLVEAGVALREDPGRWVVARLLSQLLVRFQRSNVRAVLPAGTSPFWTPFIHSLVDRQPSTWEFFPSQIQAIEGGLLANDQSYALQMPTGAGKTTLCETLLYWHLRRNADDAAVLLVPFRSLASELRGSLVRRLNAMDLPARCAYGGTVPTGEEIHGLDEVRALVATPESLSGILGADPGFAQRISLVICDEGHLLDSPGRGIILELLLARLKARQDRPTRFVFVSAIVPNIEEINVWLGGGDDTVVRSTYRPAIAEFAVLRPVGVAQAKHISLQLHPHESVERQFRIEEFLARDSFQFVNAETGRQNTYDFKSIKTQAVAAGRKVLGMGVTAIFAANKRGAQGAVGLAEELVRQLSKPLRLPEPLIFAKQDSLQRCKAYLAGEYGDDWIGTKVIGLGAVLHHGDIPQETREVLESLIRDSAVRLVICTSTLAEGVNLPIRTLILYSVQRRGLDGIENMLARDIKNLAGRAGRAGANTKGLVICANPDQWPLVEPVAKQEAGERVTGSLCDLIEFISAWLAKYPLAFTNEWLEKWSDIHPLVDGIDAVLIDLISEEMGEEAFVQHATRVAAQTFAARQLQDGPQKILRDVFELRARRLLGFRDSGKLGWARDTGARVRLIDSVEQRLLPSRERWDDPVDPMDDDLGRALLEWAWSNTELPDDVAKAYRLKPGVEAETVKENFFNVVRLWMGGADYVGIAQAIGLSMDDLLAIHARAITYALQSLIEQGVSLLTRSLDAQGIVITPGVLAFTERLRFGAPNMASQILASGGVRHRKAYVMLGDAITLQGIPIAQGAMKAHALAGLREHAGRWLAALGELVYANTLTDLSQG